jgi:hypothetical protein
VARALLGNGFAVAGKGGFWITIVLLRFGIGGALRAEIIAQHELVALELGGCPGEADFALIHHMMPVSDRERGVQVLVD